MSIRAEYVEAIERHGYTPTEARFLYLVATHSGYFTQRQFFDFAGVNRGGMGTRLTVKALAHGHIRTARLARALGSTSNTRQALESSGTRP